MFSLSDKLTFNLKSNTPLRSILRKIYFLVCLRCVRSTNQDCLHNIQVHMAHTILLAMRWLFQQRTVSSSSCSDNCIQEGTDRYRFLVLQTRTKVQYRFKVKRFSLLSGDVSVGSLFLSTPTGNLQLLPLKFVFI